MTYYHNKRIVIIGATSTIAEHCARLWALDAPAALILVGRNAAKLQLVTRDLAVRTPKTIINEFIMDFNDPAQITTVTAAISALGPIDLVLIAQGALPDQESCQHNLASCYAALVINAISPVLCAEALVATMRRANSGTLAIIASVAGDRGRKSNYIYGAAKGLLTIYAQGLSHRLANSKVKICLIKPGPTATNMTAHLLAAGKSLPTAATVAKCIVAGIKKGKPVIYAPRYWALIMLIIRHIPAFIFNKCNI